MSTQLTSGLAFPLELSSGKHLVVSGVDLIKSSINIVLSTVLKSRFYSPTFGSRIEEAIESPNDTTLTTIIRRFIIDSITVWEKRIELIGMSINRPTPTSIVIELKYRVRGLNVIDNFSYTYYTN